MKKIFFIFAFIFLIFILNNSIHASLADVKYPVSELGNCFSQQECEKYCDDSVNIEPCLNFAEKNGLMTSDEIAEARKFMPLIKSGDTPGDCKNQRECKAYCDNDANLNECIEFAKKAGVISQEEYDMVKKTGGKGPGGCKGKEECDAFCEKEENFPTCVDFAVANGLMDAKEAEIVKKTGGKGPGGCKGKEECDAFCNNEANFATCVDFSVAHGMMDAKEAEMAKKTGGKGPGGCKSKEACDAFCNNPDNQETCMNFGVEHGLLSESELANMEKNQEFINSGEGKCFMQCMKESGVDSKSCGENGGGPEACKTCGEKCFSHNEKGKSGNCLNPEEWEQKNQECQSRGEDYYLREVKGDDGQGGECVVDETCVQGTMPGTEKTCGDCASACESRPGQRLSGTDCVDNQCRCFYEDEQQPQTEQVEQLPEGGSGGRTAPGDELGQAPGVEQQPMQEPQTSPPTTESSPPSSDAPVTGAVISEKSGSDNWFIKILRFIFGI